MSNSIKILDWASWSELSEVTNIKNPVISEQINDLYTFEFDTVYDELSKFMTNNIISVDDEFFDVRRTRKTLKGLYTIYAEHVSYRANHAYGEIFEFEGTAKEILESMLAHLPGFVTIGYIVETDVKYYKTDETTNIRKQIIQVANLFGIEIKWGKLTLNMYEKRGRRGDLKFELGENLIGVTEDYDLTTENPEPAYTVDVLDLSQLKGYEDLQNVELGDDAQILAPIIDLNAKSRIVKREYDPFQKVNVNVNIGQVPRDFTTYTRDEKEEAESDTDPTSNYLLGAFKIGKVDCLQLSGVEFEYDSVLPDDISASVDYFVLEQHKGLTISVKPQYSNYHVIVTKFYEDDSFQEFNLTSISSSWNFPEKNLVALNITVSQVPLNEVNLDTHTVRNYGIKFTKTHINPLREFKIGNKNVLGMNALIDTKDEKLEIDDITATLEYSTLQQYEGVTLSLRREFQEYHTTIVTFDKNGLPFPRDYETLKSQLPTMKLPTDDIRYFLVAVAEVPESEFDPMIHKTVQYGVKFDKVPFEPLAEFSIGDTDCLKSNDVSFDEKPTLLQVKADIYYSEYEELVGLKIRLNKDYKSFYTRITTYDDKEKPTVQAYEDILNNKFPTEKISYMIVEVLEKPPATFDPNKHLQAWYAIKFTNKNGDESNKNGVSYYIESETVKATSGGAQFDFTVPYDAVISVTLGVGQTEQEEPITAYWSLIQDESEMYTGVTVDVKGLTDTEVDVSIQAVCQEGVEEEEEGEPIG